MSSTEIGTSGDDLNIQQFGGQAVIEGVMMRSAHCVSVACRTPDGKIVTRTERIDSSMMRYLGWLNWPFARGTLALLDAMVLGARALNFASRLQLDDKSLSNEQNRTTSSQLKDIAVGGTVVLSLVLGLLIFKVLPTVITTIAVAQGLLPGKNDPHLLNLSDGVIRMVMFFGYILLVSRMDQIHRVFMYHGAEHKAINTLEAGMPLSLEDATKASRIHPRCGTSFIFIVLMLDLILITVLPRPQSLLLRIALQISVIPVVAGIAYEAIKAAGKYRRNLLVAAVFAPGMATQYLTTREPEPDQIEVALTALHSVIAAERTYVQNAALQTEGNDTVPIPSAEASTPGTI